MDIPVIPKLPEGCRDDESQDDCNQRAWKFSLGTTCKLVATGFGAPEASPLCDLLSGPAAMITYPILKYVLGPAGSAMQSAIMAILPSSLTAQGVFSPNVDAMIYWQGGEGNTYPILTLWKDSIKAVQAAWDEARKTAGLPAAPLRIRCEALAATNKKLSKTKADLAEIKPSSGTNVGMHSGVSDMVNDAAQGLASQGSLEFVEGAELCLYWVLYRMRGGWAEQRAAWGSVDGDNVNVVTTSLEGRVEDVPKVPVGGDPDVWIGYGPFGVKTYGWQERTSDYARRLFHDMLVANLWQFRIDALNRAVPYVISVVVEEVAREKSVRDSVSRSRATMDPISDDKRPSGAAIATASVATVAAGAGASFVVVKLIQLLFSR